MAYMIAHIQLRHGAKAREKFNENFAALLPGFEKVGWKLSGAYTSEIGKLNELWHIWEVRDANHISEAMVSLRADPEWAELARELSEVIETEQLQSVRTQPYWGLL